MQNSYVEHSETQTDKEFLTKEAACIIAQGLILAHLDYCNSIYAGLPASTIAPLE